MLSGKQIVKEISTTGFFRDDHTGIPRTAFPLIYIDRPPFLASIGLSTFPSSSPRHSKTSNPASRTLIFDPSSSPLREDRCYHAPTTPLGP